MSLDTHAHSVQWALEQCGVSSLYWRTDRFPADQHLSIAFQADGPPHHELCDQDGRFDLSAIRTVWNRRSGSITLSKQLHPDDHDQVRQDSRTHMKAYLNGLCPDALWINHPSAAEKDIHKPLQLELAARAGLRIPRSLISNDPDRIAAFYRDLGGRMIHKGYMSHHWQEDNDQDIQAAMGFTAVMSSSDIEMRDALAAGPAIYQEMIDKEYELRITVMGRSLLAARIIGETTDLAQLDWRAGTGNPDLEPYELPATVKERILSYMRLSGLNFGCFDFIVTPAGDYVFLEVNQAGQFLWKEISQPALPLLDMMGAYLRSGDANFVYDRETPELRFADFAASSAGQQLLGEQRAASKVTNVPVVQETIEK